MISSKDGDKPVYRKSITRKSMSNGNGQIISESKGYEENSDGLKRMAFQRRLNDKYHMIAKQQNNPNSQWDQRQHLINIADEEDDIRKFHDSFNKHAKCTSIKYGKSNKYPRSNRKTLR